MVRALISVLVLAAAVAAARGALAQEPKRLPRFAGVDRFGTERFTIDELRAPVSDKLDAFARLQLSGSVEEAARVKKEIEDGLKSFGGFAFVELSVVQYFSEGRPSYLTIDVVEPADVARRMAFDEAPTKNLPDPGGVLARYGEYERIGFELLQSKELPPDPDAQRRHFHAIFGFAHPRLASYKDVLPRDAQARWNELVEILHQDRDPQRRAQAAFLLGFGLDGAKLVNEMAKAARDPSSLVRNNALRVLAEIAFHHPEIEVPLEPPLQALEYPTTTDRNKASAILSALSTRPALREEIVRRAGSTLLAMLKLEQPNNHDFAFQILKNASGESFGERDYAAWKKWLDEHVAPPPPRKGE